MEASHGVHLRTLLNAGKGTEERLESSRGSCVESHGLSFQIIDTVARTTHRYKYFIISFVYKIDRVNIRIENILKIQHAPDSRLHYKLEKVISSRRRREK